MVLHSTLEPLDLGGGALCTWIKIHSNHLLLHLLNRYRLNLDKM